MEWTYIYIELNIMRQVSAVVSSEIISFLHRVDFISL